MVKNRKKIEKLIYDTFDALDPTGANSNKYKELYSNMNDKEFEVHMKEFLDNEDENFTLEIIDFERDLKMEHCENAAKVLGIDLFEYVYMPHLSMDKNNVIVSKEKCLVGWINIKRPQQLLHKKNGLAMDDTKRSPLTGQVTGDDKGARNSDIEATFLVQLGADAILQELHGPRSDDSVMRLKMEQDIATKGYTTLEDMENSRLNKTSLNTLATYLTGCHLEQNLISDTYLLPTTLEE